MKQQQEKQRIYFMSNIHQIGNRIGYSQEENILKQIG